METNQIMDEVTMTQTGETQRRETNVEKFIISEASQKA